MVNDSIAARARILAVARKVNAEKFGDTLNEHQVKLLADGIEIGMEATPITEAIAPQLAAAIWENSRNPHQTKPFAEQFTPEIQEGYIFSAKRIIYYLREALK